MIIVKICGISNRQDLLAAIEAGADMVGFNFYPPSPRYLPPDDCARLVAEQHDDLGPIRKVGVFVNAASAAMLRIFEQCKLDSIQLSGDEPAGLLDELHGVAYGIAFKALRPRSLEDAVEEAHRYARACGPPALLLDALATGQKAGMFGGTGATGDWEIAKALSARYPILLAGGLHPGNVAQAIEQVRPWGVDVASGVESAPGRKDPQKIAAFIQAARAVAAIS